MNQENVAILDFGSQYTQLIARRVREARVYCEIFPYDIPPDELSRMGSKAIILSGGPASLTRADAPVCSEGIFHLGVPILGICYGMQIMGRLLGGRVVSTRNREYGKATLTIEKKDDIFHGLKGEFIVWMSHGDHISVLPHGFENIGRSANSPIAAMRDGKRRFYGFQFHPEVVHTPNGKRIIKNFLSRIAECRGTWSMGSFAQVTTNEIRKRVGDKRVICALSGGVDSSVLSVLLHKAIGKRLVCIFVNNGLLRKDEYKNVREVLKRHFKINLICVDAEERFLHALKGVVDPEEKRKRIGHEFIRVFEEEARRIGPVRFLAQGTLYPDLIESRSARGGPSATIKTHHNVGGLPTDPGFELIEPFKYLFKDEVRLLGKELGVPEDIVMRQPFPGPGLAVRIIGDVNRERLDVLREADRIVLEEIKASGLYRKVWQSFSVLLPIKTVGVMGDERTYDNAVVLRVVSSLDGMTADWVKLPYPVLERISNRIINEVKGINRVVYDISSKPPSTIEWE